jgi:hypothetical protein
MFTHSFLNIRRGSSLLLHCCRCRISWRNQREGMGLLEHQTVSSLPDVAHDGWLCTLTSSWNFSRLAAGLLGSFCQGNRYGTDKAGGTARPSRTKSHLPGHSPSASQAGRRVRPALCIAFGLIGRNLLGVPSRDSNPGLPYSKPAHYRLSYTVPPRATPHPPELRRTPIYDRI